MKKIFFALSIFFMSLFVLAGCVTTRRVTLSSHFDPLLAKSMLEKGKNSIKGSALIRQRGGGIVTCAGREVLLIPATDYAKERMRAIYGSDIKGFYDISNIGFGKKLIKFTSTSPEYLKLKKKTICDAQGFFLFSDIKDGGYFVTTSIVWQISDLFYEGGALMQYVNVAGGVTKNIVLAP